MMKKTNFFLVYLVAQSVAERVWQRSYGPSTKRRPLTPSVKESQFSALVVSEPAAVARLVVVGRKLTKQLPYAILFADAASVRHLRFRQHAHVLMHLSIKHKYIASSASSSSIKAAINQSICALLLLISVFIY